MAAALSSISIFLTALTCLLTGISFSSPEWLNIVADPGRAEGLWAYCSFTGEIIRYEECKWGFTPGYFQDGASWQDNLPAWFKATQGLYTLALASSIVALIFASINGCCSVRWHVHIPATVLSALTFLTSAAAVVTFGLKAHTHWHVVITHSGFINGISIDQLAELVILYGWTFWLAAATSVVSMVTTITLSILCCKMRNKG